MPPMPPPRAGKKPVVGVMIGIGKGPKMPPPSGGPPEGIDHAEAHDQSPDSGGKATREKALVIAEDHRCNDCANWDASSGDCEKVEGVFTPGMACLRYFTHANAEDEEPDEDDMQDGSGAPDDDSDDAGSAPGE